MDKFFGYFETFKTSNSNGEGNWREKKDEFEVLKKW